MHCWSICPWPGIAADLVPARYSRRLHAAVGFTNPEPLTPGHPLWSPPYLLLTPDMGGHTVAMAPRMAPNCCARSNWYERPAAFEPSPLSDRGTMRVRAVRGFDTWLRPFEIVVMRITSSVLLVSPGEHSGTCPVDKFQGGE